MRAGKLGGGSAPSEHLGPMLKKLQAAEKGPDARRRPKTAGEAYSPYVEPATEGANEADGPFSEACGRARRRGGAEAHAPAHLSRARQSIVDRLDAREPVE